MPHFFDTSSDERLQSKMINIHSFKCDKQKSIEPFKCIRVFLFMLRLVQLSGPFREYYEAKPPRLHSNENNIALTCPIKWLACNNEVNTYILLNVLVYSITEYF